MGRERQWPSTLVHGSGQVSTSARQSQRLLRRVRACTASTRALTAPAKRRARSANRSPPQFSVSPRLRKGQGWGIEVTPDSTLNRVCASWRRPIPVRSGRAGVAGPASKARPLRGRRRFRFSLVLVLLDVVWSLGVGYEGRLWQPRRGRRAFRAVAVAAVSRDSGGSGVRRGCCLHLLWRHRLASEAPKVIG